MSIAFGRRTALALPFLPALASAQPAWAPDGPVRFIQGFAPGGTTDIVARLLAPHLAEALGQPVVVENRPGAGGTIASNTLARAPADGRTMMLLNNAHAVTAATFRRLPYDPIADVAPVTQVATMGLVFLTQADGPIRTVADLIAAARARGRMRSTSAPSASARRSISSPRPSRRWPACASPMCPIAARRT